MAIRKSILRMIGNWGVSFFGPLGSTNVAETYYDIGLSFEQTVFIAFLSSLIQTGYVISVEVRNLGEKRKSV